MSAFRWGPQEEDTQKYKRKQKLYLSDRVSSFLSCKSAYNVAHAMAAFYTFKLLLMPHSHDALVEIVVLSVLSVLLLCSHLLWLLPAQTDGTELNKLSVWTVEVIKVAPYCVDGPV